MLLLSILSWRSIIPRKIYLPRQKTEQIGWWWHWTTPGSKTTNCDGESRVGLHLWSANCSNHMEAIGRIAILHYLSAPWKPEERSLLVKSLFQCLVVFGRSHRHLVKRVNLNLERHHQSQRINCVCSPGSSQSRVQRSHGNNMTHAKTATENPDANSRKSNLRATRIVGALAWSWQTVFDWLALRYTSLNFHDLFTIINYL